MFVLTVTDEKLFFNNSHACLQIPPSLSLGLYRPSPLGSSFFCFNK